MKAAAGDQHCAIGEDHRIGEPSRPSEVGARRERRPGRTRGQIDDVGVIRSGRRPASADHHHTLLLRWRQEDAIALIPGVLVPQPGNGLFRARRYVDRAAVDSGVP